MALPARGGLELDDPTAYSRFVQRTCDAGACVGAMPRGLWQGREVLERQVSLNEYVVAARGPAAHQGGDSR